MTTPTEVAHWFNLHTQSAKRGRAWDDVAPRLAVVSNCWPDELTVDEVAFLWVLDDGRVDEAKRDELTEFLLNLIHHEALQDYDITRKERLIPRGAGEGFRQRTVVRARDCARALAGLEPEFSQHLRYWLVPYLAADQSASIQILQADEPMPENGDLPEAPQEAPASERVKKESQLDRVEACLKECERRAAQHGETFDCSGVPGQKAQFLALLRRFDSSFTNLKDPSLLNYVKKARCTWSVNAKSNQNAMDFYRKLFPEAFRDDARVVSLQSRKA